MNRKQRIALISPLILTGCMVLVFQFTTRVFGERLGWYIGLVIYWLIWGAVYPWLMIGLKSIGHLIRPQKLTIKIFFFVLFPLLMAAGYRFVPGMEYQKPSVGILILLISTNIGNGFFEEILWRGVYMTLFPESVMYRIVWPSLWFGVWHYAPGSVSSSGHVIPLMIGACVFGFYLSFLALKTRTIWWSIVTHTVGGFIMIV